MKLIFTPSFLWLLCTLQCSHFFAGVDWQEEHEVEKFDWKMIFAMACGMVLGILHIGIVYYIILWWTHQDRLLYDLLNYVSAVLLELLFVLYVYYHPMDIHPKTGFYVISMLLVLFPFLTVFPIEHSFFRDPISGDYGYPL
jgi:hypothetical protein